MKVESAIDVKSYVNDLVFLLHVLQRYHKQNFLVINSVKDLE